jgi:hypothetical protein
MIAATAPAIELGTLDAPPSRQPLARRAAGAAQLAIALVLHLVALVAALRLGGVPVLQPPEEQAVETQLIGAREFEALRAPPRAAPLPQQVAPQPAAEPIPGAAPSAPVAATRAAPPDDMIRPSRMLSERALADPRSRAARRALATLAGEERIAQLCDLEAMEQIHAWQPGYQPDRLVDYARADTRLRDTVFTATGGAFRSHRTWYEVSFRCELDASLAKVVSFAFKVGEPIPREEWSALSLPARY